MFDLDVSKMALFGAIALVVIGPKELPAALRTLGRALSQVRRVQAEVRKAADTFMADAPLDREIASLGQTIRTNLALDPATAMRGSLPGAVPSAAPVEAQAMDYTSREMRAYLAPAEELGTAEAEPALSKV